MNILIKLGIGFIVASILCIFRRHYIENKHQWEGIYLEWKLHSNFIPAFLIAGVILIIVGVIE